MRANLVHPAPGSIVSTERSAYRRVAVECCLWVLLFAVLVVNLPAFLCMGLDPDVSQWDLCTRTVQRGGVLYRDAVENNLPGMLWLHGLIRLVLGWRSEVLRMVDLLIVIGVIWQLVQWLPASAGRAERLGLMAALLGFYLSTSEWVHCQRDIWMMLPALIALSLRRRQVPRLSDLQIGFRGVFGFALAEGCVWAAAFWIKPFVAVPAFLCWLLSVGLVWRAAGAVRKCLLDGAGLVAGGLVAGGAGCAWLVGSGAWPSFVEIVFVWNRQYVGYSLTGDGGCVSLEGLCDRLFPWILIHVAALAEALAQVYGVATGRSRSPAQGVSSGAGGQALLAGLYLGWLLQAVFLQHLFDYVQVPPILLGLVLVACRYVTTREVLIKRLALACLLIFILAGLPALGLHRLAVWSKCVGEGSNPALRDDLIVTPKGVRWSDLERVKRFLKDQGIKDGELSCSHMDMVPLYLDLDVRPATRFHFLHSPVRVFRRQRKSIYAELAASRQRFMVCDEAGYGIEPSALPAALRAAPVSGAPAAPGLAYHWRNRIVFRSGRYVVFRLSGAETRRWLEATYRL
jgi:hypothetical protein